MADFTVPVLSSPVVDDASLMTEVQRSQLSSALKKIKDERGVQIGVLTISFLEGVAIEEASIQVAKTWKLGTETEDNGVLLFVSKGDRKVRIEVGQGLEGDLTDAYSRRIIDYDIIPLFRQGDYGSGIIAGVHGILLRMNPPIRLEDYWDGVSYQEPHRRKINPYLLFWVIVIIILIINYSGWGGGPSNRFRRYGGYNDWGSGGGFGGDSGGGWSGGGGGFSGGGASGSW